MHTRHIDPRRDSSPVSAGVRHGPRPLPPDLLREASQRLGVMALMGVMLWVTGTATYHVALRVMGSDPGPTPWLMDAIAAVNVVLSLAFFAFSRRPGHDPQFVLDLGLVYLIETAFSIGLVWHSRPIGPEQPIQPMITWVGVLVIVFAAIVPNSPGKILVAGLVSASMTPIGMLISRAQGIWRFDRTSDVLLMHYPDLLMVGVAVVIAKVMTGMGQHLAKAREMGSYELGELLGEGGMGAVYRATHRMLARPAAIKLIRPEMLSDPGSNGRELAVKRFKREALVAANLRSPHTVELYDFGVTEDQTFYFVMELLEGLTLDELVRRTGMVPAGRVIHILKQVCESLEEAHTNGLIHRDIKPANIHIGRLGLRYDFVKVLDFGLVKSTKTDDDRSLATAVGLTPGTPAFMAPEMSMGDQIDGRADLYALGCVAYYLLTEVPVFTGENVIQVMAKHLNVEPVPPSKRAGVRIPKGLERLVMALLAKNPADRPQTASELARGLAEVEAEPWGVDQAAQWWREHPVAP